MLSAYFLGLIIFFDDYANSLLVGNSMKKLFEKFKISKEKLAYIVDSTAAPIASIAIVSTWIGFELGEINKTLPQLNNYKSIPTNAYQLFINSLPYSFYPILTLVFMLILILTGKDFGPMKKFEQKAMSNTGRLKINHQNLREPKIIKKITYNKKNLLLAYSPILVFISVTIITLLLSGKNASAKDTTLNVLQKLSLWFGNADSNFAILIASLSSLLLSILCTWKFKSNVQFIGKWFLINLKKISPTLLVLLLAWTLSHLLTSLNIAIYFSSLISDYHIPIFLFPGIVFILAAIISFSTGSSWSTMTILYGIVIPIAAKLSFIQGTDLGILYASIAAVLGGAVLGDHCSPISDTTIMSSLASDCQHINHVKSQLPYALTTGTLSIVSYTLVSYYRFHPVWIITATTLFILLIFNQLKEKRLD